MALANSSKIGEAYVEVRAELDKVKKGLKNVQNESGQSGKKAGSKFANSFKSAIAAVGIGLALRKITRGIGDAINLSFTQAKAEAKVEQAVRRTGQAAELTASQLKSVASQLQAITGFGDEQILNDVTAQFLTFGNIAGDVFLRAQKAALDLATVIGTDLRSQSIQLGKALDDPIRGITALSRAGVTFSDQQKEMIKNLVEQNELGKAQALILDEIESKYGGQAKAEAEAVKGIKQLNAAWGDLGEAAGNVFLEIANKIAGGLGMKDLTTLIQDQTRRLKEWFGLWDKAASMDRVLEWEFIFKPYSKSELEKEVEILEKQIENIENTPTFGATIQGIFGYKTDQYRKDVTNLNILKEQLQSIKNLLDGLKGDNKPIVDLEGTVPSTLEDDFLPDEIINTLTAKLERLKVSRDKLLDQVAPLSQAQTSELARKNDIIAAIEKEIEARKNLTSEKFTKVEGRLGVTPPNIAPESLETVDQIDNVKIATEKASDSMDAFGEASTNALSGLSLALSSQVDLFQNANSFAEKLLNTLVKIGLQSVVLKLLSSFSSGGLGLFGAQSGGVFGASSNGITKMATGGGFTVPLGNPNDTFPMLLNSGEKIEVKNRAQQMNSDRILSNISEALNNLGANLKRSSDGKFTIINTQDIESRVIKDNRRQTKLSNSGYKFDV